VGVSADVNVVKILERETVATMHAAVVPFPVVLSPRQLLHIEREQVDLSKKALPTVTFFLPGDAIER